MSGTDDTRLKTVATWLNERAELFTISYRFNSGGSGDYYFVRTLDDVIRLIGKQRGGDLTIFREQQFPLRGVVDDAFIQRVSSEFEPEQAWKVFRMRFYPEEVSLLGGGDVWEEVRADLEHLRGATVCAGPDPVLLDDEWVRQNSDKVLRLEFQGSGS